MLLVKTIESTENKNCKCRQTVDKKMARNPAADSAELETCKLCCVKGKCTINQLLKICQEDPDSIMNAFKIATAEDKCLPQIEMDKEVFENDIKEEDNKADGQNKYHFLMVDNSTSLYRLQHDAPPVGETQGTGKDILETRQDDISGKDILETRQDDISGKDILETRQDDISVLEDIEGVPTNSSTQTSLPSNESKDDTESSIVTAKSPSLEKILDKCRRIILWSDSDDQTPPSGNSARQTLKKPGRRDYGTGHEIPRRYPSATAGSDKSSDGGGRERTKSISWSSDGEEEERERTKSILWSSESYLDSVDTTEGHQLPYNWYLSPVSSERSSLANTPTSYLNVVVRQKRVQMARSASTRTLMGMGEVRSKSRSKYWPRCFNCFKRRKKDKQPDKQRKQVPENTNETEETDTQY